MVLALGGRCFMIKHHDQPNSWQSFRGGARVKARGGGEHVGGCCPIVWTIKLINNKIFKKMHVGLRWLLIQNFKHDNHQKHVETA